MSSSPPTAYLLVSHGSRDPRPQAAMNRLAQLVRDRIQKERLRTSHPESVCHATGPEPWPFTVLEPLKSSVLSKSYPVPPLQSSLPPSYPSSLDWEASQPYLIVGTACLELAPLPLHEQIYEFCLRASGAGVERVQIVPIFLLEGVHVMQDIPEEVALAQQKLESVPIQIELCRHLGSHPGLCHLLKSKMADTSSESWLLLAHGSRRPGGNRPIEALAEALNAAVALWSVPGNLENQVVRLMQAGCQRLTILPYFLFTGDTTDAITRVTEELAERFPRMSFRLLPPLGATIEVAQLVAEIALNCCPPGSSPGITPMKRVALRH